MSESTEGNNMTALTEFLFPSPARRAPGAILKWWEKRRFAYNVIVGTAGLVSLGAISMAALVTGNGAAFMGNFPWIGVVVFGVMANVCYSAGGFIEMAIDSLSNREILPTGPGLYRMGLTFSVGLALFPSLLVVLLTLARLLIGPFI